MDSIAGSFQTQIIDEHGNNEKKWQRHCDPHNVGGIMHTFEQGDEATDPTEQGSTECLHGKCGRISILEVLAIVILNSYHIDLKELLRRCHCVLVTFPYNVRVVVGPR